MRALREELDVLERHHVATAIAAGWSWSRVAQSLGVTKQAAHRKHSQTVRGLSVPEESRPATEGKPAEPRMIVSGDARRTVGVARDEARRRGAAVVGTEHLLLAVMKVGGGAADVLLRHGVEYEAASVVLQPTLFEEDQAIADRDSQAAQAGAATGVSPLARACLEQALREALARRSSRLEVGDLVLALLRAAEGGAMRTLTALGVEVDELRTALEHQAPRQS